MTDLTPAEIVAFRQRLGLTQEQFAQRVGCTTSMVNRWENGAHRPSRLAQRAMAHLLAETSVPGQLREAHARIAALEAQVVSLVGALRRIATVGVGGAFVARDALVKLEEENKRLDLEIHRLLREAGCDDP